MAVLLTMLEVVRLKFQWNWATPGGVYLKSLGDNNLQKSAF